MTKYKNLFEWITDNGGFIHPHVELDKNNKLQLSEKMGGKGVQIISLPRKLSIDSGTYKNFLPPKLKLLEKDEIEIFNQPFFKLILNLISEKLKGKNSFYYQFIATLPTMEMLLKSNPIFYYNERKTVWKKILPTVITKLDNLNELFINLYKVIYKLNIFDKMINMKKFSRKQYKTKEEVLRTIILWAFLIVNSYGLENSYLLPMFNLMHYNHETTNRLIVDGHKINYVYNSISNEKLVINNGLLDNESLFTFHGYINNNKKKFVEIKLGNKYTVENDDVKKKIEETLEVFKKHTKKFYLTGNTPSDSLLQYLRILSLNNRDLQFVDGDEDYYKNFISVDNESGVYQKLLKITKIKYEQIKKYDDIVDEKDKNDIKILKVVLKEQKRILKSMYYEIHKKWIGIMETNLDENLMQDLFNLK